MDVSGSAAAPENGAHGHPSHAGQPRPQRRTGAALALALLLLLLATYLLWQPWPRPTLFGSDVGIRNAHVGTTYVCGDAVFRADDQGWPVEVLDMALEPIGPQDVEAVLFAADPGSPYYSVGAGVYSRPPDLGQQGLRTSGFDLEPGEPVLPHRVLVAVTPQDKGTVGRFEATIRYRYRWLPPRSANVSFDCTIEANRAGPDPRVREEESEAR